jgi:hypothetical protein
MAVTVWTIAALSLLAPPAAQHPCNRGTPQFTRQAVLKSAVGAVALGMGNMASAADSSELIFNGVLQSPTPDLKLADGAQATVTLRVVGRNTNGPMGTLVVPVGGVQFPVGFAITRAQLREGMPDFVWLEDDIYLKVTVANAAGKVILAGKSKSKFGPDESGKSVHKNAYVTLE